MKTLWILALLLIPLIAFIGCAATRAGYESPEYTVVKEDGPFEIRDYPELIVASTSMTEENPGKGGSFMKLFRYISKGNKQGKKISMTTPVLTTIDDQGGRQMNFVVPKEIADAGAPDPSSDEVRIRTLKGGRFAVYRFSGSWNPSRTSEARKKLNSWMTAQKLQPASSQIQAANYDPPFTPPIFRRNEVMMRIENP